MRLSNPIIDWDSVGVDNVLIYYTCVVGIIDNVLPPMLVDHCDIAFNTKELYNNVIDWKFLSMNDVLIYPTCFVGAINNLLPNMLLNSCDILFNTEEFYTNVIDWDHVAVGSFTPEKGNVSGTLHKIRAIRTPPSQVREEAPRWV